MDLPTTLNRAATAAAVQVCDPNPSVSLTLHDPQEHYVYGDVLEGQVCIKVPKVMEEGCLQLSFQGLFTMDSLTGPRQVPFIHLRHHLWSTDPSIDSTDTGTIPQGTHLWPFTFTIPSAPEQEETEEGTPASRSNLPPTFQVGTKSMVHKSLLLLPFISMANSNYSLGRESIC